VQTEVPTKVLEEWLGPWRTQNRIDAKLKVELRPHTAGSELLELRLVNEAKETLCNVIFAHIHDRRGRSLLSVRDQNTVPQLRQKRLMTLVQLFLIYRYKAVSVHYVTPTDDNLAQTAKMKELGIFTNVTTEVGQIIVADVNRDRVAELVKPDHEALQQLIQKAEAKQAV
jgi:isocitrate lyase